MADINETVSHKQNMFITVDDRSAQLKQITSQISATQTDAVPRKDSTTSNIIQTNSFSSSLRTNYDQNQHLLNSEQSITMMIGPKRK